MEDSGVQFILEVTNKTSNRGAPSFSFKTLSTTSNGSSSSSVGHGYNESHSRGQEAESDFDPANLVIVKLEPGILEPLALEPLLPQPPPNQPEPTPLLDFENRKLVLQIQPLSQTLVEKHMARRKAVEVKRKRGRPRKVQLASEVTVRREQKPPIKIRIRLGNTPSSTELLSQKRARVKVKNALSYREDSEDWGDGVQEKCTSGSEDYMPAKTPRRSRAKVKVPDPNPPQVGPCPLCQLKFHSEEELGSHECRKYAKLPSGRLQCGLCLMTVSKKEGPSHMRRHTGEKPYVCQWCPQRFKDKRNCRVHERIHNGLKPFKCKFCGQLFNSSSGKIAHEHTHGEAKFMCSFEGCGKSFHSKTRVEYHERRHRGDTIPCKVCGIGIFQINRNRHERRCQQRRERDDAMNKPYEHLLAVTENQNGVFTCKECRLRFKTEFDYITHDCCHFCRLDVDVWRCGICGKIKKLSFTDMKSHMKYHQSDKEFSCPQCGKGFRYESEMNRHVASHAGEKKFVCETCGAAYTNKQRFVLHLKRVHPDIPVESVIEVRKRNSEGRMRDKIRQARPGYKKRYRGPNRKSVIMTPGDARGGIRIEVAPVNVNPPAQSAGIPVGAHVVPQAYAHGPVLWRAQVPGPVPIQSQGQVQVPIQCPVPNPAPVPLQVPAHYAQQQQLHHSIPPSLLQAYSNYTVVPDPWNFQWQIPGQGCQQQPQQQTIYYQCQPQQPGDSNGSSFVEPGPSSAASGSLHGSFESEPTELEPQTVLANDPDPRPIKVLEVEPDFDSLSAPGTDWENDDFEDPWETAFPPNDKRHTPTKAARTDKDTPVIMPRVKETLPKVDESGLFTKIEQKKWACNQCSRTANRRSEMASHCRIHTGEKPFGCPQCDHRFKDKRNMMIHIRCHTGVKPYTCPVCFMQFRHNAPFNVHKRSHGDLLLTVPPLPKPPPPPKKDKSRQLNRKVLASKPNLSAKETLELLDLSLPIECELCLQRFQTEEDVDRHSCVRFAPLESGYWKCGACKKTIKRKAEMISHVRVHTDERPFVCDECGKAYKDKRTMTRHQEKSHQGKTKTFTCSICSKTFTTNYNKDIHERKHRQEQPFLCSTCGMGFFDKQSYRHHMERHEAGGPTFPCSVCSAELTTRYELCLHSKTHGIYPKYKPNKKKASSAKEVKSRVKGSSDESKGDSESDSDSLQENPRAKDAEESEVKVSRMTRQRLRAVGGQRS